MNKPISIFSLIVAAQLAFFNLPLTHGASIEGVDSGFDVVNAISTAKTQADQEKIATYYEQQAVDFESKISQHERMKAAYNHGGHLRQHYIRMRAHCDKLIAIYKAAANENRDMAAAHRAKATALKNGKPG